jgi:hypothetical protein
MHYAFAPNRDSGSVRRHRNPDTKRRHGCSNVPHLKCHSARSVWSEFVHAYKAELFSGLFDVSLTAVRSGWDDGDPQSTAPVLTLADPFEELEPYPDIPEWAWLGINLDF